MTFMSQNVVKRYKMLNVCKPYTIFYHRYVPLPNGGGHIVFGTDPVGISVGVRIGISVALS